MNAVPAEIVSEIGKYLDMQHCIAFAKCCKKNQILNKPIQENKQKWDHWYESQTNKIKLIKIIKSSDTCGAWFDKIIRPIIYFVFSREIQLQICANKIQAQWIEFVCTCLKIDTTYNNQCVTLEKKTNWTFMSNKTMTYESFSRKIRRKKWKEMQKERCMRLKKWSTNCIVCTKKLSAYTAFYNLSNYGPVCIPCIQDDDNLEMTEWQNYARLN